MRLIIRLYHSCTILGFAIILLGPASIQSLIKNQFQTDIGTEQTTETKGELSELKFEVDEQSSLGQSLKLNPKIQQQFQDTHSSSILHRSSWVPTPPPWCLA